MRRPLAALALALAPTGPLLAQEWIPLEPENLDSFAPGLDAERLGDGSLRVSGTVDVVTYHLLLPVDLAGMQVLRIEALPDAGLPMRGPGRAQNGNFVLSEVRLASRVGRVHRELTLDRASASYSQVGWAVRGAIDGREETGWAIDGHQGKPVEALFHLAEPLPKGRRTLELDLVFAYGSNHILGRFRVSASREDVRSVGPGVEELTQFQRSVNAAIQRGMDYLIAQQDLDGSWRERRNEYAVGGTALNAYALLKSGMKPEHQVLRRALAYVDAHPPSRTYEAGCVLMLYAALDHAQHGDSYRERAKELLANLLDWQLGDWGYGGSNGGRPDLSNTQYGTLGFWAATKMGLEVPPAAWKRLVEAVLRYQSADGAFTYTPGEGKRGSMAAAGVAVLALALPHLEGELERDAKTALDRGLAWLDANFTPTENPGNGASWLLYYLYGIERVGAFADRQMLNGMDWYREGARYLLKAQKGGGNWDSTSQVIIPTSFALLFLNRASASLTGPNLAVRGNTYGEDDPSQDVSLRASGDTPLSVWISSFGEDLLDGYTFEGEREKGPRVVGVEYLTSGAVILADNRWGGTVWRYTTRSPLEGWKLPRASLRKGWKEGAGGFGVPDSPQVTVRTPWKQEELFLAKDVELDPADLVAPRLEVLFSSEKGSAGEHEETPLAKLYDEEGSFKDLLAYGQGQVLDARDAASGQAALAVSAVQRQSKTIPGWSFRIREKPKAGEYRYLRFRWRKPRARKSGAGKVEGGIMLQLAFSGRWKVRYLAGKNTVGYRPTIDLDTKAPEEWTTVTRDLWADAGDSTLTGISLTAMDGTALFDGIYLARKKADFRHEKELVEKMPSWMPGGAEPSADGGATILEVWVNGKALAGLDHETDGYEILTEGDDLRAALRKGKNRIAVRAVNSSAGRALDVGITDDKRLAVVKGDPTRPADGARFAARVEFPRPGDYPVWARVTLLDGVTQEELTFESEPLLIHVREAFDPTVVEYARDASRNLLAAEGTTFRASSEFQGWPAAQVADGRYDNGWLCADGDDAPWIEIKLRRPVRADTLLLSHTRMDRRDSRRTTLPVRVAVLLNDKEPAIVADMDASRLRKTEIQLGKGVKVRTLKVRILGSTRAGGGLTAVGFSEVELLRRRR